MLKASYVGNLGRNLDTTFNLNQAIPGSGAVNNRRPFFAVRPTLAELYRDAVVDRPGQDATEVPA